MTQFQVYLICIKIEKCVKFHTYEMKKTFEITNGELWQMRRDVNSGIA